MLLHTRVRWVAGYGCLSLLYPSDEEFPEMNLLLSEDIYPLSTMNMDHLLPSKGENTQP